MTTDLSPSPRAWSWLTDTYWYVPPANLPALRYDEDDNTLTWLVDQTDGATPSAYIRQLLGMERQISGRGDSVGGGMVG
ncbi:MAG TPA: hypothetical protein VLQ45_20640 [Thermoanaerobaculia bacterium]|nr:hypothetical protein [Thermoanaerobaculia bacterium]